MQQQTHLQSYSTTLDAKTSGAVIIDITESSGKQFYPLFVTFEIVGMTSYVSGLVIASVGTNASSYNNILAATTLTGLTSLNTMLHSTILLTAAASSVSQGTTVKVNLTGVVVATTATLKVILHGFYH